jgi:hypothetical protein
MRVFQARAVIKRRTGATVYLPGEEPPAQAEGCAVQPGLFLQTA